MGCQEPSFAKNELEDVLRMYIHSVVVDLLSSVRAFRTTTTQHHTHVVTEILLWILYFVVTAT
jgi:hypothetical protein